MMKLAELLEKVEVLDCRVSRELCVNAVTGDSRKVRPGDLFVAIKGLRRDGAEFAGDAVDRGAVAVMCDENTDLAVERKIVVRSPRRALGVLAALLAGSPSEKMVVAGITGTNGKTTTAGLLSTFLREGGGSTGLISTVQYEIGDRVIPAARTTPEASELQPLLARMLESGCTHAVMEVSSHALDQHRVAGVRYQLGLFTNLSRDHLDYHGDMETYFAAKRKLFLSLVERSGSIAVINADDAFGRRLVEEFAPQLRVVTFGIDAGDYRGESLTLTSEGSRFRMVTPEGVFPGDSALPGRFNVYNVLGAVAAARELGVPMDVILRELPRWFPRWGRMERITAGEATGGAHVFVDYAHTDDALRNALNTLRELTPGRVIVVFGCGGDRDRGKRPLMGEVAGRLADVAVVTSDNPRSERPEEIIGDILKGFPEKGPKPIVVVDRKAAIARALSLAGKNDCVLVAGKGHEPYQELAHSVAPFDDREVVKTLAHRE